MPPRGREATAADWFCCSAPEAAGSRSGWSIHYSGAIAGRTDGGEGVRLGRAAYQSEVEGRQNFFPATGEGKI